MTFRSFIENSRAEFEHFPSVGGWLQGGFISNRQLQKPEAGYCVVIRYDENTNHMISRFMQKVLAILPAVVEYDERTYHTTMGVFKKGGLKGFIPDPAVLKSLRKSVEIGLRNAPLKPEVTFEKWLFNHEAILISGYPNQDLWRLSQKIGDACLENRVLLEPWRITHITTARFIRSVPRQVFEQFLLLMESAPLIGLAKPCAIDIATWQCDGLTFEIATHERYPL